MPQAIETDRKLRPAGGTIAVVTVATLIGIFSFLTWDLRFALIAIGLGWTMIAIAWVDAHQFRIPDVLSFPATAIGLLWTTPWLDAEMFIDHAASAVLASGGLWLVRAVYGSLRGREGLGLGDVKLAATAGAWTGTAGIAPVLLLASLTALIVTVVLAKTGFKTYTSTTKVPFGTFLAPAIWVIFAVEHLPVAMTLLF